MLTLALKGIYSELVNIENLAKALQQIKYQAQIKKMNIKEIEHLGVDLHSISESLKTTKEFFDQVREKESAEDAASANAHEPEPQADEADSEAAA